MVFALIHYLNQYLNKGHKYKADIHQEHDKQDEISLLINVHELHEIHIIPMLVQNVGYTTKKKTICKIQ